MVAFASHVLVCFYTAVLLVLGTNVGTTITAILASIGTNRVAKRTAVAHTMFNVFGSMYMYGLLFVPLRFQLELGPRPVLFLPSSVFPVKFGQWCLP